MDFVFSHRFDLVFSENLQEFLFLLVISVIFEDVWHSLSNVKSNWLPLVLKKSIIYLFQSIANAFHKLH